MSALEELPKPRVELRRAILESDLRAWQIAHLAGLSPTIVSLIGSGRRDPQEDEAERLAKVLGSPVSELFPGEVVG